LRSFVISPHYKPDIELNILNFVIIVYNLSVKTGEFLKYLVTKRFLSGDHTRITQNIVPRYIPEHPLSQPMLSGAEAGKKLSGFKMLSVYTQKFMICPKSNHQRLCGTRKTPTN